VGQIRRIVRNLTGKFGTDLAKQGDECYNLYNFSGQFPAETVGNSKTCGSLLFSHEGCVK
jgi:hypothetical protein